LQWKKWNAKDVYTINIGNDNNKIFKISDQGKLEIISRDGYSNDSIFVIENGLY